MKSGMKVFGFIIGAVLLLTIIGIGVRVMFFPAHVADKAMDTAEGVVDQTLNADNALFNYENFKDLYNGAKSQKVNIDNANKQIAELKETYGEPTAWTEDIRKEHSHLKENIAGFEMQYQSLVKQYNSDSSKLNRNLFKDNELPSELPLDYNQLQ